MAEKKNRTIVAPEDLRPRLLVTVFEKRKPQHEAWSRESENPVQMIVGQMRMPGSHPDEDSRGVPLRVIAVQLPYVTVASIKPDGREGGPAYMDTREYVFMRVDRKYVENARRWYERQTGLIKMKGKKADPKGPCVQGTLTTLLEQMKTAKEKKPTVDRPIPKKDDEVLKIKED